MLGRCFKASNKATLASSNRPCELRTLPKLPSAEMEWKNRIIISFPCNYVKRGYFSNPQYTQSHNLNSSRPSEISDPCHQIKSKYSEWDYFWQIAGKHKSIFQYIWMTSFPFSPKFSKIHFCLSGSKFIGVFFPSIWSESDFQ